MARTENDTAGAPPSDVAALSFEQALAEAEQKIQAIVVGPAGLSLRDVE